MELALFVILTFLGGLGYLKSSNLFMIGMSMVSLFTVAVFLAAGEDVVNNINGTENKEIRSANGTLLQTESTTSNENQVIISSDQVLVAWIYYGFATFTALIFMYRTIQLGSQGRF